MTDQTPTIPPDDQAQLNALAVFLPLLQPHIDSARLYQAATENLVALLEGNPPPNLTRDAAYAALGVTSREFLRTFAALSQPAQGVGTAIAKYELKIGRAKLDVVTGHKGAPPKKK